MQPIILTASQARQIEREGSATYPNECCGIMLGKDTSAGRRVETLLPMPNVFDQALQRRRFSIDPLALISAEKQASESGQLVLGFYHSHPDHPAKPSEYDREHVWPFYSYIIVSIARGEAVDMTCWVLDETTETFSRQEIEEI